MRIRLIKGVAGNWKGKSFRFPRGHEADFVGDEEWLARDLMRGGNAIEVNEPFDIPEPEALAITPMIKRVDMVVKKRGRRKRV